MLLRLLEAPHVETRVATVLCFSAGGTMLEGNVIPGGCGRAVWGDTGTAACICWLYNFGNTSSAAQFWL